MLYHLFRPCSSTHASAILFWCTILRDRCMWSLTQGALIRHAWLLSCEQLALCIVTTCSNKGTNTILDNPPHVCRQSETSALRSASQTRVDRSQQMTRLACSDAWIDMARFGLMHLSSASSQFFAIILLLYCRDKNAKPDFTCVVFFFSSCLTS